MPYSYILFLVGKVFNGGLLVFIELCKGKLVKACGLGWLYKAHSKPGTVIYLSIIRYTLNTWGTGVL